MVYKPQKLASTDGGTGIGSYTKGDILVSDVSGKLSKLSVGTDGYAIVADSGQSSGLNYVATSGFGKLIQQVYAQTTSISTITTIIPLDNTIPQISEGTQVLSATITPLSASNNLEITVEVNASIAGGANTGIVALFDGSANAIAATCFPNSNSALSTPVIVHQVSAGATTSKTFSVRCGPDSANNFFLNRSTAGSLFGGVVISSLTIKEYAP